MTATAMIHRLRRITKIAKPRKVPPHDCVDSAARDMGEYDERGS